MRSTTLLATVAAWLVAALAVHAASFSEDFDDGVLDPNSSVFATPGFHLE